MSYIVFARKYRPQAFDDVVGQAHITTTLSNAIAQGRVAHAYIFAGPRGVGKTTAARILAKALNCETGPTATPCNKCASCVEIGQGSSLDVLEIDGASNRGIDEIRNLRENAKFSPAKGRSKLYIIDEVHMLTPEAFNALLKTLEEPPAHVTFVLATTHAHKVPPTILSRCQRFDFRRLATKDIAANLREIVKREKLRVDDAAIALVARHADGSMRDGQVVLDQIVSFSQGAIGVAEVTEILGIVGDDILFSFSDALVARDAPAALALLDKLIDGGKDAVQVLYGLIRHFRNISVAKVSSDLSGVLDGAAEAAKRYEAAASKLSIEEILYIIATLTSTVELTGRSKLARIPFEAALIKLAQARSIVPLGEIMKRVERLEGAIKNGAPAVDPGPGLKVQGKIASAPPGPRNDNVSLGPRNDNVKTGARPRVDAPEPTAKASSVAVASRADSAVPAPAADGAAAPASLMSIVHGWQKVIAAIGPRKMSIASYLQEGNLESLDDNVLTMSFASEFKFHKEMLETTDNKALVEGVIKEVLGLPLKIDFRLAEFSRPAASSAPGDAGYGDDGTPLDDLAAGLGQNGKEDDPLISSALQMFGGEIAQVSKRGKAK